MSWNPEQYAKFRAERARPFEDLLAMLVPAPGGAVLDLGCGPGDLTARLHDALDARVTVGADTSASMLERARAHASDEVRFVDADLREVASVLTVADAIAADVIVASASLQWVPDHARVLAVWRAALVPGGQLAGQVPANPDHPSHRVSSAISHEEPFLSAFGGAPPPDPVAEHVLDPARYAEILDELGATEQRVRLEVYGHHLASSAEVVEWVKGTSLTRFEDRLDPALFDRFVARYREVLLAELGDRRPYFYAFKRTLWWARF